MKESDVKKRIGKWSEVEWILNSCCGNSPQSLTSQFWPFIFSLRISLLTQNGDPEYLTSERLISAKGKWGSFWESLIWWFCKLTWQSPYSSVDTEHMTTLRCILLLLPHKKPSCYETLTSSLISHYSSVRELHCCPNAPLCYWKYTLKHRMYFNLPLKIVSSYFLLFE